MQNKINFPLYDLDLAPHVHFKQPNACYLYDLFGIVNHFGTLNGGHYVSTIRNACTGEWLEYNDSTCRPITES